jgi:hypothetical protein
MKKPPIKDKVANFEREMLTVPTTLYQEKSGKFQTKSVSLQLKNFN